MKSKYKLTRVIIYDHSNEIEAEVTCKGELPYYGTMTCCGDILYGDSIEAMPENEAEPIKLAIEEHLRESSMLKISIERLLLGVDINIRIGIGGHFDYSARQERDK